MPGWKQTLVAPTLVLMMWSAPAAAMKECPLPTDPFEGMDVVVDARETVSPFPGVVVLIVNRYHKGEGGRILVADVGGFDRWYTHWSQILYPNREGLYHRIIGLRRGRGFQLTHLGCDPDYPVNPNHYLTQALPRLGGGHPPAPGITMRSNGAIVQPALLLAGGIILWLRRRRLQK